MSNKIDQIKKYFQLQQWFNTDLNEFKAVFHQGIELIEFPNLIIPITRKRTFANLLESTESGKKMLAFQHFEPVHFFESGDTVIAEYIWTGELKQKAGRLKQGQVLKAHICSIFEFREEKIYRQRNYDCYEPVK
jgi:ketosteroid isomerase-like protein